MKNFFASMLGSFLGVIIASVIAGLILVAMITGAISGLLKDKDKTELITAGSVLHLKFDKKILERSSKNPFENISLGSLSSDKPLGLNDILATIAKAKDDEKIKGIYLDLSAIPSGIATIEELRLALLDFRKSKKFIVSYGETYTQGAYYLASVSDKIFLNPAGAIEWKGLSAQIMFYKGLLDKLEVSAQIFRHGKFKSAIEPFDLDKMSPANRTQTTAYVGSIWNHIVDGVSAQRNIPVADLNALASSLALQTAADAKKFKFADELFYKDEVLAALNKLAGKKETEKLNLVTLETYSKEPKPYKTGEALTKNKIAIIYAVGEIEGGEGDDKTIGSERISKAIREARLDSSVKAIVLRVNSPGGSALASDVIWRETILAKKAKPFIVSMGDVAASGGYYIACGADRIFAQPNTITGSIGVFGLLPNLQKLLNNKMGITIDTVKTNRHADLGSLYRPVTAEEGAYILASIQHVYNDFITKVGAGRKMDTASVDSIGQGRVWSGVDAKGKGLVDELGGINEAIAYAAKQAKIDKYKIVSLPKQKDAFSALFSDIEGDEQTRVMQNILGERYEQYQNLKALIQSKGIQARIPYTVILY
jgi:protease-4